MQILMLPKQNILVILGDICGFMESVKTFFNLLKLPKMSLKCLQICSTKFPQLFSKGQVDQNIELEEL